MSVFHVVEYRNGQPYKEHVFDARKHVTLKATRDTANAWRDKYSHNKDAPRYFKFINFDNYVDGDRATPETVEMVHYDCFWTFRKAVESED